MCQKLHSNSLWGDCLVFQRLHNADKNNILMKNIESLNVFGTKISNYLAIFYFNNKNCFETGLNIFPFSVKCLEIHIDFQLSMKPFSFVISILPI